MNISEVKIGLVQYLQKKHLKVGEQFHHNVYNFNGNLGRKTLNISPSTIYNLIKRFKESGEISKL